MRTLAEVFPNRLCGVLRTDNAEAGFQACLSAMEGGVMTIEVTKTVPSCFEMIRGLIATTMGRYPVGVGTDRKSTRLNSSHANISYAVFCLKKKKHSTMRTVLRKDT